MNKLIYTLICTTIFNVSYCQPYENLFGSTSTQWTISIGNLWGTSATEHNVVSDTIIDNKSYKVIDGYSGFEEIQGYLRQDSLGQKAWYRNNQMSDEILVMDLTLDIGDSLYIQGMWNSQHKYYKVDSIYNKNNRKHIQFDFPFSTPYYQKFTLIEGLVSSMGFRYQDNDYINGLSTFLLCANKDEQMVFGYGDCTFTSTNEVSSKLEYTLSPNPVLDRLNINFNQQTFVGELKIFDLQGKMKYALTDRFSNQINIDLSKLNGGFYFVHIYDVQNQSIFIKKIIKVNGR